MPTFLEKDLRVLIALFEYRQRWMAGKVQMEFGRMMDVVRGPRGDSENGAAMKRLIVLGLVERRQRTDSGTSLTVARSRASYEYRITEAGIAKLSPRPHSDGSFFSDGAGYVESRRPNDVKDIS